MSKIEAEHRVNPERIPLEDDNDTFYGPRLDQQDDHRRFRYKWPQKRAIIFSFFPTHRIWDLGIPKQSKITLDILYLCSLALFILLIIGSVNDSWPVLGVTILVVFMGLTQFYLVNFTYISRTIKHQCLKIPGVKQIQDDLFEPFPWWSWATDMYTKYHIELALELQKTIDIDGKFTFQTLHPSQQLILNRILNPPFKKTTRTIEEMTKEAIGWRSKDNGLQLVYAMTRYTGFPMLEGAVIAVEYLVSLALLGIMEWVLGSVLKTDLYGVTVRIIIPIILLLSGNILGFSVNEGGIDNSLTFLDPNQFISLDNVYRKENSHDFLIDIFSISSLESWALITLQIRSMMKDIQRIDNPRVIFALVYTLVIGSIGLAIIVLGYESTQTFGYGIFSIFMTFSVIALIIILISVMIYGIVFNNQPKQTLLKLEELKTLYKQLQKVKHEGIVTISTNKFQFFLACTKNKNINFDELIDKIDELKVRFDNEDKKNAYKALSFIPCEKENITSLFTPLAAVLWTAIIHSITVIQTLGVTSYVS